MQVEEMKEHIYPKGGSYRGEWLGTMRHGKGRATWADGTYYEGDWCKNKREGYGKMWYPDGSSYEGQWQDG